MSMTDIQRNAAMDEALVVDTWLNNWARVVQLGPWPGPVMPDHCRSVEHEFAHHNSRFVWESDKPIRLPEPDFKKGAVVEQIVVSLPQAYREALVTRYVKVRALPDEDVARELGIPVTRYAFNLTTARLRLLQRLINEGHING